MINIMPMIENDNNTMNGTMKILAIIEMLQYNVDPKIQSIFEVIIVTELRGLELW